LAARGGCVEDLANLLCSLLIGFGLNAWVCLGSSIASDGLEDAHAWVVSISSSSQSGAANFDSKPGARAGASTGGVSTEVIVWEPLTGERLPNEATRLVQGRGEA